MSSAEESEARARTLAQTLQQTLIPPTTPDVPGLDVATAYRPAGDGSEVGGDFYDVFQIRDGEWVAFIGDVRGKGADAAVVAALARYTLRAAAVRYRDPHVVLEAVNQVLLQHAVDRFCTVAYVRLMHTDDGWEAVLCCAGHPLPVIKHAGGSTALVGTPGTLLGVVPDVEESDLAVPLAAGDVLLLYTDGVTEARTNGDMYGDERLLSVVATAERDAQNVTAQVLADVLAYQAGDARDDVALVAIAVP